MVSPQQLPEIGKTFADALIINVTYGPRQEFTLACHELIWNGQNGHYDKAISYIRFGGVTNLEGVKLFFAAQPYRRSEIRSIAYAPNHTSKIGHIFVEISFERIEATLTVECRNIRISHEN